MRARFEPWTETYNELSDAVVTSSGEDDVLQAGKEALENTRLVVQKMLCPLVVCFGVVGNVITMAVLTRPSMRSSTSTYLTVLAVCDTLYLLLALSLSLRHYDAVNNTLYYPAFEQLVASRLANVVSNAAVCIIVTFTVERYLAIRQPLRTVTWNTPRRALLISLIVCAAASAVTMPNFAERYAVISVDAGNITRVHIKETSLSLEVRYTLVYSYLVQALFTFLPLFVLSLFNSLLLRHVVTASRQRRLLADGISLHQQHEQNGVTVTLIAIVLVFVVCQLPQAVLYLYKAHFVPAGQQFSNNVLIAGNVCNLLVMVNAACNFLLFSAFSSRFRLTFYGCCCHGDRSGPRRAISSNLLTTTTMRIVNSTSVLRMTDIPI